MRRALFTMLLVGAPRAALACPVCFGQSDAPMAKAMNVGIMLMLVVVVGVLGAFASFIVTLARRSRLAPEAVPDEAGHHLQVRPEPQGRGRRTRLVHHLRPPQACHRRSAARN